MESWWASPLRDDEERSSEGVVHQAPFEHHAENPPSPEEAIMRTPNPQMRKLVFDDTNLLGTNDGMIGMGDEEAGSHDMGNVWDSPDGDSAEDQKIQAMIRETLRDNVNVTEDNIGEVSDKVKSAYTAPDAGAIRSSHMRKRMGDLVPRVEVRKTEGIRDVNAGVLAGRSTKARNVDATGDKAQFMVTDAYMEQKRLAYESGR
jgi:hypothetical protein